MGGPLRVAGNLFGRQDRRGQDYDSSAEHQFRRSSGVALFVSDVLKEFETKRLIDKQKQNAAGYDSQPHSFVKRPSGSSATAFSYIRPLLRWTVQNLRQRLQSVCIGL